jgi:hypothetical protein
MGFWDFLSGSSPAGVISDTGQKVVAGVFQGVKDLIEEFHLSPEQAQTMKLKLAEIELQAYQAQITDVQSARQMQMSNKSAWPGVLTVVIVGGFYGVLAAVIWVGLPSTTAPGGEAILMLIGSLTTALPMVLSFWFGTTQGSQNKDRMLMDSVPASTLAPKP